MIGRTVPGRGELALLALVALAAVAWWTCFRVSTGIVLEDALITFRFAESLASGRGFAFNPGEPVLGTTTPLLTLLLAGFGAVFGVEHVPLIANAFLIPAGAAALVCLHLAARRAGLGAGPAFLGTALVAFHPDVAWSTAGGMETPLVLAWMAASLLAAVSGRWTATGVLLAFLVLTRVDAVFWALVLAVASAWRRPAALLRMATAGTLVFLPWATYALLTFGTLVPHTMIAKRTVVHTGGDSLLRRAAEHAFWYVEGLGVHLGGGPFAAIVLGSLVCLVLFGGVACFGRAGRAFLLPLGLFVPVLAVAYFLGRAPHEFGWYLVPVTFCALPLAQVGAFQVGHAVRAWSAVEGVPRALGAAIAALLLAAPVLNLFVGGRHALESHARHQRIEDGLRRRVGEWLDANAPPDASVAMEAIGYQGTFARRRVIDLAGLVSPDVVRIHVETRDPAEAFRRVMEDLRPDYIVLRAFEIDRNESFFGGPLAATDAQRATLACYREAARFMAPEPDAWSWDDLGHLVILRRADG
jgi:hypothetical protein